MWSTDLSPSLCIKEQCMSIPWTRGTGWENNVTLMYLMICFSYLVCRIFLVLFLFKKLLFFHKILLNTWMSYLSSSGLIIFLIRNTSLLLPNTFVQNQRANIYRILHIYVMFLQAIVKLKRQFDTVESILSFT